MRVEAEPTDGAQIALVRLAMPCGSSLIFGCREFIERQAKERLVVCLLLLATSTGASQRLLD